MPGQAFDAHFTHAGERHRSTIDVAHPPQPLYSFPPYPLFHRDFDILTRWQPVTRALAFGAFGYAASIFIEAARAFANEEPVSPLADGILVSILVGLGLVLLAVDHFYGERSRKIREIREYFEKNPPRQGGGAA